MAEWEHTDFFLPGPGPTSRADSAKQVFRSLQSLMYLEGNLIHVSLNHFWPSP